jgi:hypothetical protein
MSELPLTTVAYWLPHVSIPLTSDGLFIKKSYQQVLAINQKW